MPHIIELETKRLFLRQWKNSDFDAFSAISADERVMEFFPSELSKAQSDAMALKCQSLINERGWGFWALEEKRSNQFIGFTGLHNPTHSLPFMPCVEIGWRLSPDFWGQGLVTEAAQAALKVAFTQLNLDEIVSFTVTDNLRSQAVMKRLGMIKEPENFEHPALPVGHKLREHVLYKIHKSQWLEGIK
jgi:RimJ/RimL family protein N-acetyltransferase